MSKDLTEIAFILDRSGSMASMTEAAISGFNAFLRDQTSVEGVARLTLVLFDDRYEVPCAALPIGEVTELDTTTFVPRGSTALLDAIGRTVDELGVRLAALPEADRPGQVVIAILTDGLENSSTQFDWKAIQKKITHQSEKYGWQFLFLGANQDAIATAGQMGIATGNAATWNADAIGARTSSRAFSKRLRSMREAPASPEAHAPMSELVREEDEKERGGK